MKVATKLVLLSFFCISISAIGQKDRPLRQQPDCYGKAPLAGCIFPTLYSNKAITLKCNVNLKPGQDPGVITIKITGDAKVKLKGREVRSGETFNLSQFKNNQFKVYAKQPGYMFPNKPFTPGVEGASVTFTDKKGIFHGGDNATAACNAALPRY